MNSVVAEPELDQSSTYSGRWMVVIFNNDHNSVDEVVEVLMRATGCDVEEAAMETWEAHMFGKAAVHFASKDECETVAEIISAIGVKAIVSQEWDE